MCSPRPNLGCLSTPEDESAAAKQENEDDDNQQRLGTHSWILRRPNTRGLYQKEQSCSSRVTNLAVESCDDGTAGPTVQPLSDLRLPRGSVMRRTASTSALRC